MAEPAERIPEHSCTCPLYDKLPHAASGELREPCLRPPSWATPNYSISAKKGLLPIIKQAIALGGYAEDQHFTGINGGETVTTGFARNAVLSVADQVINGVKSGAIRHFFLVGGCDGARPGRNYYTEFVKQAPKDTVILTLACGKVPLQ